MFLKKMPLIVIRGGGSFASAIAHRLYRTGHRVLMLEQARPAAIRREVAFSEAVYSGVKTVERIDCYCASNIKEAMRFLKDGKLTMMVDPVGRYVQRFGPHIVVDALKSDVQREKIVSALYTISLGAGFSAGRDVDCVIETLRGHDLGRLIYKGRSKKPTGMVMAIADGMEHLVTANAAGVIEGKRTISSFVKKGDIIAEIFTDDCKFVNVLSPLDGVLRGVIHDGCRVQPGMRIAEVDPRSEAVNCFRISDRARCVSGSVLEAIMFFERSLKK